MTDPGNAAGVEKMPIPMGVVAASAVETPGDAADASDDRITH